MRSAPLLVAVLVVSSACSVDEPPPPTRREAYIREARELLPEEGLRAAVPEPFEAEQIVVSDTEFRREGWITIGVRMGDWPDYARAIFYVLPTGDAARELFSRQRELTLQRWETERRSRRFFPGRPPRPFSVMDLSLPNICGLREGGLLWCHAVKDRVYLLVQVGASSDPFGAAYPPERTERAFDLLRAFGRHLASL